MPLYIMLANLTGKGRRMSRNNPDLLSDAASEVETPSSKVLTQYAVLGQHDFVIITEAADNDAAARLSLELGVRAGLNIETLPAMPLGVLSDEEHISILRDAAVALNLPNGPEEAGGGDEWRLPEDPE
ncbi:MAG: GYD domain-containing protein [Dehalococcoidia bacterium]|nr:GYD domain-containing protein [Dehalococcoidia bacterium]